jgi:mannosyltransferase OCH1-like enzyme
MPIPKIVHQTITNPLKLTPDVEKNIRVMKLANPEWEFRLYSGKDRIEYIASNFPSSIIRLYLAIDEKYGAARADLFRYLVIKNEGGVYLDIKSAFVKPLSAVISPHDQFISAAWPNDLDGVDISSWGIHKSLPIREFPNSFIISQPNHPILHECLERVAFNILNYQPFRDGVGREGVLKLTGPIPYTKSILPYLETELVRISSFHELGFRYTFFPYPQELHFQFSEHKHYTKLFLPITTKPKFESLAVRGFFRLKKNMARLISKLRKKFGRNN